MSQATRVVKVSEKANDMLTEISKKRKADGSLVRTKQDILAELIQSLHKKECK
jgi:hypothetical protein